MNELIYNFLNQIDDPNIIKEISLEEFINLVKSNKLITEDDADILIESFKKILSKKDETSDTDERKKKYREQQKTIGRSKSENQKEKFELSDKENDNDSLER